MPANPPLKTEARQLLIDEAHATGNHTSDDDRWGPMAHMPRDILRRHKPRSGHMYPRRRNATAWRTSVIGKFTLAALCLLSTAVHASTPDAARSAHARNLAANCTTCHATDSRDAGPIPRLGGQAKAELLQKLNAFRTGERPATVMHQIARGYTDEQLELIIAYFAAQP